MTNHESTALAKNPNIKKPAYKKDAIVILKADYTISEFNENLTEGAVCTINKCGCSKYAILIEGEKVSLSTETDGEEWCFISIITDELDLDNDQACVRAKDLKLVKTSLIHQNP